MSANMMYTAVAGLDTFNEALSVVSDNIANANTTGFKSNTVDFGDLVSGLIATSDGAPTAQGVGSSVLGVTSDFTTGAEIQTGNWSDLMNQGTGFFAVQNPTSNAISYTRDGSFELNSKGLLTDMNGNDVLDSAGNTITVAAGTTDLSVDQFGNLSGVLTGATTATYIDTIGVTSFSNPNGLIREGSNDFTAGANVGTVTVANPIAGAGGATSDTAGTVISGALEGSNVDLTSQMVNLINYQADYQANSKSISTASTDLQTVVNLIR
jgi:flagellar basal body rod protein FlgG